MSTTWRIVIVLLAVGFLLEAAVVVAVMRELGGILVGFGPRRAGGPPPGPNPGTIVDVPELEPSELPALVVFMSSTCKACEAVAPRLRWMYDTYGPHAQHGHQLDFVAVLTDGTVDPQSAYLWELADFARTDLVALMKDWEIPFVPFVVALDQDRTVVRAAAVTQPDEMETIATIGLSLRPVVAEPGSLSLEVQRVSRNTAESMGAMT